MLIAAVASNLGLLPGATKDAVPLLQSFTVKLATPLLLFSADLRRVAAGARDLLPAFALGAAGTLVGAVVADALLHDQLLALGEAVGGDSRAGLDLAGALAAKNIGGGLNYVAVASALEVPRALFTAGIAIDNIAALVYFPLVSALGSLPWMSAASGRPASPTPSPPAGSGTSTAGGGDLGRQPPTKEGSLVPGIPGDEPPQGLPQAASDPAEAVMLTLAAAFAIVALTDPLGRGALPASTAITVALATAFPDAMGRLAPQADMLGKVLLFVFFASAGAAADSVRSSLGFTALFAFLAILYVVHLGIVVGVGRLLLRIDGRALMIASNANIGGPATAASMASAKGWDSLLVPGVLAGNLGNATATFLGIALAGILQR